MPEAREGLLIDFGGVLTSPVTHSFRAFCEAEGLPSELVKEAFVEAYRSADGEGIVARLEVGELDAGEFGRLLCGVIENKTGVQVDEQGLIGRLFAGVELDERMLGAVQRLRESGARTCLLSNSWGESGYPRERFDALFDAVVISSEVGMRKPDPRIFAHAVEQIGLAPEACVFVDDLDHNARAAEALGIVGVVHRRAQETLERLAALFALDPRTLDPARG